MQNFLQGNIFYGNLYAKEIQENITHEARQIMKESGKQPCLAVILVGSNPASKIYVANKQKFATLCGIKSVEVILSESISEFELLLQIESLNTDPSVHGILVQMPLPRHINPNNVIKKINPHKDVDGFHQHNMGALLTNTTNESSLLPCTPLACMKILNLMVPNLRGKNTVVIGASNIVGKPVSAMLINQGATVSVLNSTTKNLPYYTKNAEILITACGVPNLIKGENIQKEVVVLDVGINRLPDGKIIGDCHFETCKEKAQFITPVPKGIGPMTITMLLQNTIIATKSQLK